jgi:hypothetical protein
MMRGLRPTLLAAVLTAALAAACASFDGRGLVPGKSTQAEVEALMGAPAQQLALPGGETALYFSRLPEGRAMFVVTVGPDGVMKSIEQRLVRKNLAGIVAGASNREDVRSLFGPPGRTGHLALQEREWWEYKYFDYEERRVIWVQFSGDGVAREVLDMLDWEYDKPGGPFGMLP